MQNIPVGSDVSWAPWNDKEQSCPVCGSTDLEEFERESVQYSIFTKKLHQVTEQVKVCRCCGEEIE